MFPLKAKILKLLEYNKICTYLLLIVQILEVVVEESLLILSAQHLQHPLPYLVEEVVGEGPLNRN